jgi:hypothetical protein
MSRTSRAGVDTGGLRRLFHGSSPLTLRTAPHVFGTVRQNPVP